MKKVFIIIISFLFSFQGFAQKKEAEKKPARVKIKPVDTLYYIKYKDRLIVSFFQSYRTYGVEISQKLSKDSLGQSKINYLAESNHISGIELNYDKLNIQFGYNSKPPANQVKKGETQFRNIGFNIGGDRWLIENSYRSYKGFYNNNTGLYDTTFKRTGIYTKQGNLHSELFKTKFLFYTNSNKFSRQAGYTCADRQLKSAFSFVLTANIYYNRLNSDSDSSFIPSPIKKYYDTHQSIYGLNVAAFSVYGGGSFNLVIWKTVFFNMTLMIGPEEQWRTYSYKSNHPTQTLFYTSISGDFRASFGLNYKRFFTLISGTSDYTWYNNNAMDFKSTYKAANFSIGYRFGLKTPKIYKKFQETRLYKNM